MTRAATPHAGGFLQPAEWSAHAAVWLAWPSHDALWQPFLPDVQKEFIALAEAIADVDDDGQPRGETLNVLVPDGVRHLEASTALEGLSPNLHRIPFGDIWMRDVAPIFVVRDGEVAPVCFAFNGWGGKYILDGDDLVAGRVAEAAGGELYAFGWVLEGGAVEPDGEGTLLTTRQCLLNPNRNRGMERSTLEAGLRDALGAECVLWLEEGLSNDHTDGHVDTLVRFVEPGRVVCMEPAKDDPNRDVLEAVARDLAEMKDKAGRSLQVERVPSPGPVEDHEGMLLPASYMNFYLANTTVVVPTYGSPQDDAAVELIGALFPTRRAVGVRASTLLLGGGAVHCITQPQPAETH
ncbi:MAG: agmatine deiminase family protein [Sandaracinaceae bacterium]